MLYIMYILQAETQVYTLTPENFLCKISGLF